MYARDGIGISGREGRHWSPASGRTPSRDPERCAQVALMQEVIARAWNVPVAELRAPTRRHAPVAQARQVAMYLTHVAFGFSLSAVGRYFGRDRTTAAHACRLIEDRRDDADFDLLLDRLEQSVRAHARGRIGLPGGN